MLAGFFVEIVVKAGRVFEDFPRGRILAIQNAQGVRFEATLAIGIQVCLELTEVIHEGGPVNPTGLRRSDGIDLKPGMLGKPKLFPEPCRQDEQFGINVRTVHAKTFHANLMKLAIAAFLRTFVPEHRAGVPETAGLIEQKTVLFGGPNTTGGALRAEGQTVTVAVFKGVHFLFDDVGHFTNRTLEQIGLFHNRHADFLVAILGQYSANRGFHKLPNRRLLRQDIVHPANCLNLCQC